MKRAPGVLKKLQISTYARRTSETRPRRVMRALGTLGVRPARVAKSRRAFRTRYGQIKFSRSWACVGRVTYTLQVCSTRVTGALNTFRTRPAHAQHTFQARRKCYVRVSILTGCWFERVWNAPVTCAKRAWSVCRVCDLHVTSMFHASYRRVEYVSITPSTRPAHVSSTSYTLRARFDFNRMLV